MSPTAAAEATVAEATAPETMLDAIGIVAMDSAVVVAARTIGTGIAGLAAVRPRSIIGAAGQNEEGGQRKKRIARRSPFGAWFSVGVSVEKFRIFHG